MRHHSEPIDDPSAWTRDTLLASRDWIITLSDAQRGEADAALSAWRAVGGRLHQASAATFPLPGWSDSLAAVRRSLIGRGVALIKGFPVAGRTDDECAAIYWGVGAHLGVGVTQTNSGDLMVPVYDRKFRGESTARAFGYASDQELEFHVDPTDVVGLLCIRRAKQGGETRLASAASIHNAMLAERPDLLAALYAGFAWMRRYPGGGRVSAPIPVFARAAGRVISRFHRRYIDSGARIVGTPPSAAQNAALDYFAAVIERPDLVAEFTLEPGDLVLINNYAVLHAKKAQCDEGDPSAGRLLQRLWLYMPEFAGYDLTMRQEPGRYGTVGLSSAEWWARGEAERLWSAVGLPPPATAADFTEDWPELEYTSSR